MEFSEMLEIRMKEIEDILSNSGELDLLVEHIESDIHQNKSTITIQTSAKNLFPELNKKYKHVYIDEMKLTIEFTDDIDFSEAELKEC